MFEPFRFLDLPKELGLMVYDFFPITTTPLKLELEDADSEKMMRDFSINGEHNLWRTVPGHSVPKVSVSLIQQSLSGLAILRTCRTVASEAGTILTPKLMAMRESPTTFMVNSITLISWELEDVLCRLAQSRCMAPKDCRILPQAKHMSDACLQINIIIDSFIDRTAYGRSMNPRDIVSLKLALLSAMEARLKSLYDPNRSLGATKPARDLSVNFCMVLLSEQEKAAFGRINSRVRTVQMTNGTLSLRMDLCGELKGEMHDGYRISKQGGF